MYDLYADGNMEEGSELGEADKHKRKQSMPRDGKPGVHTATVIMGEEIAAARKAGWQQESKGDRFRGNEEAEPLNA